MSKITTRASGAGRAIVGAGEEVLCWDVKKGELLRRWWDPSCNAEVTSIARSNADPDIYAVGYGKSKILSGAYSADMYIKGTATEVFVYGIQGWQRLSSSLAATDQLSPTWPSTSLAYALRVDPKTQTLSSGI